jgi:tol-pal system protein YbgF
LPRPDRTVAIGRAIAIVVVGAFILAAAGLGRAQDQTIKPLLDRLDRLERDVNMLQRQVYRGTTAGGTPAPVNPPDAQSPLSTEVRVGQLEDQMRTVTGQMEEINYTLDQLKHRLDTLSSDIDQRLSALEQHPGPPGKGGASTLAARTPPPAATPPVAPPSAGANPDQPASAAGILGTLATPAAPDAAPPAATTPIALPTGGTPQEQYNFAFGLLRGADYANAEQALRSFIQRYPNNELAGNAQYWLGETFYVRKDYENAATAFALGYQKYPKSGKAADNLLKLGMSLASLGKKTEACSAYTRLDRDFPTAPSNIKERLTSERQQLGC